MANDLRVLGWITKVAQFSGQDAKMWYRLTCRDEIIVRTKAIIVVKDWIIMWKRLSSIQLDIMLWSVHHIVAVETFDSRIGHHVKKGKRGACKQKAATVLPARTAAT